MDQNRLGGLVAGATWLTVTLISFVAWPESVGLHYLVLGSALYLIALLPFFREELPRFGVLRVVVAWLSIVFLLVVSELSFLPILTVLLSGLAIGALSVRQTMVATFISTAAYFAVWSYLESRLMWAEWLLWLNFHGFCIFAVSQSNALRNANLNLEAANQQLVASQLLLGQAVKEEERARIFRDMHDRVGHLITALSVRLQLAEKQEDPSASITEARTLCSELLAELRRAVHASPNAALDIRNSLNLLKMNAPQLSTAIHVGDTVRVTEIAVAEAILRVSQEALSNTIKHAKGTKFTLSLTGENPLVLDISDNGVASPEMSQGFGISSMKQRVEHLGGEFKLDTSGGYCHLTATFPVSG